jgi:UDP-3-O-[3-hydroxymyristoyl] glucosamine N-acyltransferase
LHGPADFRIRRPAPADSDDPEGLAFAESEKYLEQASSSGVGALLLPRQAAPTAKPCILVDQPRVAFGMVLKMASRPLPLAEGVHPTAVVHPEARVAATASIGAFAVVERGAEIGDGCRVFAHCYVGENCRLGSGTILYPHAVLYQDVSVGERSVVHAGAVLGADGFGYAWDGKRRLKVPQVGRVVLGDDVEIGALAAVDRATAGTTTVGNGTKIDNLVQVGHNCRIGEHGVIASQTGLSGSVSVGDRAVMGGQVGTADHVAIGDDVTLGARSGIMRDIPKPGAYLGAPAKPFREEMRLIAMLGRLPELMDRVKELERRLAAAEGAEE